MQSWRGLEDSLIYLRVSPGWRSQAIRGISNERRDLDLPETDARALERSPNFLHGFKMCADGAIKVLQATDGGNGDASLESELMLLPPDERPR